MYPGASGDFSLYRDDGLTYDYVEGEFKITNLHWDDAVRKLSQSGPAAWSGDGVVEVIGGR